MTYTINIVLCLDTYEPIFVKHGMMRDTTVQFGSSLIDLGVHSRSQGHGKARTRGVQTFMVVDFVIEMTEQVLYGEYESLEHLLFLFLHTSTLL